MPAAWHGMSSTGCCCKHTGAVTKQHTQEAACVLHIPVVHTSSLCIHRLRSSSLRKKHAITPWSAAAAVPINWGVARLLHVYGGLEMLLTLMSSWYPARHARNMVVALQHVGSNFCRLAMRDYRQGATYSHVDSVRPTALHTSACTWRIQVSPRMLQAFSRI